MGAGRPLPAAVSLTVGAMVAVGAHLILTRQFGGTGAALSMTLGTAAALLSLGAKTLRFRRSRKPVVARP
jgi:uncharacterized membrane protein (UPF0136 family)